MKKITLILIAVACIGAMMFSSCKKSTPQSTITFVNDTYTPINIVVNGAGKTIPAEGGSVVYVANVNTQASVSASTSGTYGATITWSFTDYFPSSGGDNLREPLDVDAQYFYLEAKYSTSYVKSLIVNEGFTDSTNEIMTIPNDGNTYSIGYYPAFSNTMIKATFTDDSTFTIRNITIPHVLNASYTAYL